MVMFANKARTVGDYLKALPPERRAVVSKVRGVVKKHLPKGYREQMNWGAITYAIPLETFPDTYNGQPLCYAALAATKNHFSLYLMSVYGDAVRAKWLEGEFKKRGLKLDRGKSCVRFKTVDDLPLDAIAELIASVPPDRYIERYRAARARTAKGK
jgi:hypothetical protein